MIVTFNSINNMNRIKLVEISTKIKKCNVNKFKKMHTYILIILNVTNPILGINIM